MDLKMMDQELLPCHIRLAPNCHDPFNRLFFYRHFPRAELELRQLSRDKTVNKTKEYDIYSNSANYHTILY